MSEATLGFKIDSSQASSAAVDLEKLDAAAKKVDATAEDLSASARELGTTLGETGKGAGKAATELENANKLLAEQDEHVRAFRAELERLTLRYQPLSKAQRDYEASVSEIERAHKLGVINAEQMSKALDRERMAFERLKTEATGAGAAVRAANQNNNIGAQRAAGINAGYQLQDIAVSAPYANPLMVGLQQGTQLASALSTMEKPVAGLVAAFTSLVNPISLVTIGLTTGVAALIHYFVTAKDGTDESNAKLEEQAALIGSLADKWGEAVPALRTYANELERARDAAELKQGASILNERTLTPVREQIKATSVDIAELVSQLQAAGEEPEVILNIQAALNRYNDAAAKGTLTTKELNDVQKSLADITQGQFSPALQTAIKTFDEYAKAAGAAADQVQRVNEQAGAIAGGLITGKYPSQGNYGPYMGYQSPDFSIQGQTFPLPEVGPVPTPRPTIELSGDGTVGNNAAMIVNSDGKLVAVPIPQARPNFFEQQALTTPDIGSRSTPTWSDAVIKEEQLRSQVHDIAKGFLTDFRSALEQNGGNVGKALLQSIANGMMNAANSAFNRLFDMLATSITNAVLGAPSQGLLNKGIGFTGANTTLGSFLGMTGGQSGLSSAGAPVLNAANSNVSMSAYQMAIKSIESSGNYSAIGPLTRTGDRAYGAYQVMGANIGPWSQEALGRTVSTGEFLANPSLQDQIFNAKFGGYVSKYGPSGAAQAWFGGPGSVGGNGMGADILGTTGNAYVEKFNNALGDASKNLGTFSGGLDKLGNGLSSIGSNLASGGGGGSGWLSFLSGTIFSGSAQLARSGGIGLFAKGTNSAPGGMAIVGEDGPELVNLPQGSKVYPNGKTMEMMAANGNQGRSERPQLNVYVQGANTDEQIRMMSRQGAEQALAQYTENQTRGGFGHVQNAYTARKA